MVHASLVAALSTSVKAAQHAKLIHYEGTGSTCVLPWETTHLHMDTMAYMCRTVVILQRISVAIIQIIS